MDRVVDGWIAEVATAFSDVLIPWEASEQNHLDWDTIDPAIDAAEDAIFWTLLYSHARGVVDVRERLDVPVGTFADFVPTDAVRAALDAAGYSFQVWQGIALQFGEFASVLATKLGHDVYSKIAQSLGDALAKGQTKAQWVDAAGIKNIGILKDNPWYISNVYRTNTSTYYAAGKWHAITEVPEIAAIVEFLEFISVVDDRTTPVCEGMDGTIKPVDDPIWATHYPPNHYMCRSTVEPISRYERAKPKDPTHLDPPGEGFAVNVGQAMSQNVNEINSVLKSRGMSREVVKRQEDIKNRIISSTLLDKR